MWLWSGYMYNPSDGWSADCASSITGKLFSGSEKMYFYQVWIVLLFTDPSSYVDRI